MSKEYINQYIDDIARIAIAYNPLLNTDSLRSNIKKIIKEKLDLSDVYYIENNYKDTKEEVDMLDILTMLYEKKYSLSGYGVFFDPDAKNYRGEFLDYLLASRKVAKGKMLDAKAAGDVVTQIAENLIQLVYKLFANSYFGVLGEKNSQFFNPYLAPSVLNTSVQLIGTALTGFEMLLGNNIIFYNGSELIRYINNIISICKEDDDLLSLLDEDKIYDVDTVYEYLIDKLQGDISEDEMNFVKNILTNVSNEVLQRIYYINNLYPFLSNTEMTYILDEVLDISLREDKTKEDKNEYKEKFNILYSYISKYIVYPFVTSDKYIKILTMIRYIVITIDTDSNFLNMHPFVNWVKENFFDVDTTYFNDIDNRINIIDIVVDISQKFIGEYLDMFTKNCNVREDRRSKINMKNEYVYSRLMLTRNKKQYAGRLVYQEGRKLPKPELDIKGISIKKSTVNKKVRDYFSELIEEKILKEPSINVVDILTEFKKLEDDIYRSLYEDLSTEYCIPVKVSDFDSYAFPNRMQAVRAAKAYNYLYPNFPIETPSKVLMVKLKCDNLVDLMPIINTPEYQVIYDNIFNNEDEDFASRGFKVFAVPYSMKKLPEFLRDLIDYDSMVNDNIGAGLLLLESLGIKIVTQQNSEKQGRKYISNIIPL